MNNSDLLLCYCTFYRQEKSKSTRQSYNDIKINILDLKTILMVYMVWDKNCMCRVSNAQPLVSVLDALSIRSFSLKKKLQINLNVN